MYFCSERCVQKMYVKTWNVKINECYFPTYISLSWLSLQLVSYFLKSTMAKGQEHLRFCQSDGFSLNITDLKWYFEENHIFPFEAILKHTVVYMRRKCYLLFSNISLRSRDNQVFKIRYASYDVIYSTKFWANVMKKGKISRPIGLLQQTITWYKIRHAGWQAHYYSCTGTLKQRDLNQSSLTGLCFNFPVRE